MNEAIKKNYGDYEILFLADGAPIVFSEGAADITYKARDTRLDRNVLLRMLRSEFLNDMPMREIFLREVRFLAKIRHSNIPGVISISDQPEECICAMEDPGGESLGRLTGRVGCMDTKSSLTILDQSAKVLREIWQSGLVITQLNPSCVFVCYEGDELMVKFINLHVAASSEVTPRARQFSALEAGDFRSPEEVSGGIIDIRSNIYSIGLLFCELLAGKGASNSFLSLNLKARGPDLHQFRKLPEKILYLLERLLDVDPERRIQNPYDIRSLVEQCEREEESNLFSLIRDPSTHDPVVARSADGKEDIIPQEFNLMNLLDAKGAYQAAEDRARGGEVVIHVLGSDESPQHVATCARIAEKLTAQPHGSIIRPVRISLESRRRFIAYERVQGFTLLELLRKRRRLSLSEVMVLLNQAASAADHAVHYAIPGLVFSFPLVRIVLDDGDPEGKRSEWIMRPVDEWPPFTIKVPVYGSSPDASMGEAPDDQPENGNALQRNYMRGLAEIAHELLGGIRPRNAAFNEQSYIPISSLSELGNQALRHALFGGEGTPFSSAADFLVQLRNSTGRRDLPPAFLPMISGDPIREPSREGVMPRVITAVPRVPLYRSKSLLWLIVVVAIADGIFFYFWKYGKELQSVPVQMVSPAVLPLAEEPSGAQSSEARQMPAVSPPMNESLESGSVSLGETSTPTAPDETHRPDDPVPLPSRLQPNGFLENKTELQTTQGTPLDKAP